MRKIGIKGHGYEGTIKFDDNEPVHYTVTFPDDEIRQQIISHLNTPREYRIPESQQNDADRVNRIKPVDSQMYFKLALSSLGAKLDIGVEW